MELILKRGKEQAVKRFHPWIFSGAIYQKDNQLKDGDIVKVKDSHGNIIATGHFHHGSIAVRILAFEDVKIDIQFWKNAIQTAFNKRKSLSLKGNAYRLIHAEGDHLPGLIVDIYDQTAVVQCHSIGMHLCINDIANAIMESTEGSIQKIYDKSKEVLPFQYASDIENSYIIGDNDEGQCIINENENAFRVNWKSGQKTGFFLDQRNNRQLLNHYCKDKSVLNTFCYSGGFSVYALNAGASLVHSVDISQKAIDLTDENIKLTQREDAHQSYCEDVMQFLKNHNKEYDIVIVDPPAFAKNIKKRHNAVQGYKRLNALALQTVKKGGIMFTFSCSQVIDTLLFQNTIVAAALEAGKKVSILHRLSQSSDHPVNLFHPEGNYLKGLVLFVE